MSDNQSNIGISPLEVIEAAPESVLITGSELDEPGPSIIYVNPAFERMTGWSKAEILGKSPKLLQGPNTDLRVFSDLKEKLRSDQFWEGQAINYRKDGSEFWMEWSIVPLKNQDGETYQYLAIQRDVTSRVESAQRLQEAQAAEQKSRQVQANLSRYFSPKLAEILAEKDKPLGEVRRQHLAVMFADIVGFTKLSEALEPEQVIGILRDIHSWVEKIIFKWNGSIEGYIGDAILAIFGFPEVDDEDASNSLACSFELISALREWNSERINFGLEPISIGIGLNYGPVVLGDVGSENYVEFTIIGDTVNTASRLQQATRTLECDLIVSQNVLNRVKEENLNEKILYLLNQLVPHGYIDIRGRTRSIEVSTYRMQKSDSN